MTTVTVKPSARTGPHWAPATLIGARAAAWLRAGVRGEVLAVVSQAAYLRTSDGTLLWLSPPGSTVHPRAVLALVPPGLVMPGSAFSVDDGALSLGDRLRVRLEGTPAWQSPAIASLEAVEPVALCARARRLAGELAPIAPERGLGFALAMPGGASRRFEPADPDSRGLRRLAQPALARFLRTADASGLAPRVEGLADALLGLGPGLTPSGDDFLGGVLFAMHLARAIDPRLALDGERVARWVVDTASTRTNVISAALLADYAMGEGPGPLMNLGICLVAGDKAGARMAAAELGGIGGSTGWDTLAGLMLGIIAVCGESVPGAATQRTEKRGTHGYQGED